MVNEKHHGQFADIHKKASDIIEALFAVELKGMDSTQSSYVLVSIVKLPNSGRVQHGRGLPKTGLLMSILGLIFLNGNCATEEEILEFLNTLWYMGGGSTSFTGNLESLSSKI